MKLKMYDRNDISLKDLKEILIKYYYPNFSPADMKRELFITEIKDCYGTNSTTIFSINGSPPKGIGILLRASYEKEWIGQLILIGNGRTSKSYYVKISGGIQNERNR